MPTELPGYLVVPNESCGDYEAAPESPTAVDNGEGSSSKARSMDKSKPPPDADEFYDAPPAYVPPTPAPGAGSGADNGGRADPDPPRRQGWRSFFRRQSRPASPPGPSTHPAPRHPTPTSTATAVPAAPPPTSRSPRAPHPEPQVDHLRITPSKGDITIEWVLTSSASAFVWPYIPGIADPPPCACGDAACRGGLFVPDVWRARKPAEARGGDGSMNTVISETFSAGQMPIIVRGQKLTVATG